MDEDLFLGWLEMLTRILVDAVAVQKLHRQHYHSSDFHILPLSLPPRHLPTDTIRFKKSFMVDGKTSGDAGGGSEMVALAAFGLGQSRRKEQKSGEITSVTEVLLKAEVHTMNWLA